MIAQKIQQRILKIYNLQIRLEEDDPFIFVGLGKVVGSICKPKPREMLLLPPKQIQISHFIFKIYSITTLIIYSLITKEASPDG